MNKIGFFILLLTFFSCAIKERPIDYGVDDCTRCIMKLMDQRYGCEIVTSKGKILTFDAIECMVPYLKNNEAKLSEPAFVLVTPYTTPGLLFDAKSAYYLRSAKLPSPMGGFLTAFTDKRTATEFQEKNGGKIYSWDDLYTNFKEIRELDLVKDE